MGTMVPPILDSLDGGWLNQLSRAVGCPSSAPVERRFSRPPFKMHGPDGTAVEPEYRRLSGALSQAPGTMPKPPIVHGWRCFSR